MGKDIIRERHFIGEWRADKLPWGSIVDMLMSRICAAVTMRQRFRVVVEILEKEKKKPTPQGPDKGVA